MQSSPDPLHVVCATEGRGYIAHCATMLHSLMSHQGPGVRIEYLHDGELPLRAQRRLRGMIESLGGNVRFQAVPDSLVAGLPVRGFTGKAPWYRVFLTDLLPDVTRVLHLDADLLVLESLGPLWEVDLGANVVAAVTNVPERHNFNRPQRQLGMPEGADYFNAGVLLLDLEQMRLRALGDALCEFARANGPRLEWRDQDALNCVLHAERLPLHPRWNCMNAVALFPWASDFFPADEITEAIESPAVRHYEGPRANKPWHLLADRGARELYLRNRRMTPWPTAVPEGCTPPNLVRYVSRRLRGSARSLTGAAQG